MDSLRLEDFHDFELLYILEDVIGPDGYATSADVAESIGIEGEHPVSSVGIRLGWMIRYGVVEKDETRSGPARWRLTRTGDEVLHPKNLPAAAEKALAALTDGQRVAVTDQVMRQLRESGSSRQAKHLARRSYKHNLGGWRDETIAPKRKAA